MIEPRPNLRRCMSCSSNSANGNPVWQPFRSGVRPPSGPARVQSSTTTTRCVRNRSREWTKTGAAGHRSSRDQARNREALARRLALGGPPGQNGVPAPSVPARLLDDLMEKLITTIACLLSCLECTSSALASQQESAKVEFFEAKIRPVLVRHCYQCHSVESGKTKGGLLLDSRQGWQVGGDSGPAIVPKKPDESILIAAISHNGAASEMPPKSRLSRQVVDDFRKWIADGAVDPRAGKVVTRERNTIDIEAGRAFWSFQPRKTFSADASIDRFVEPQAPVAPATKLVRRLFLDLIGLPPTLEERDQFLRIYEQQSAEKAVQIFADRLLNRREFGEKWARHWLDVARYADSNGGDFNLTFPEAWRYRNYVIDAFNSDMPYDQFLREQIAGDLLPAESVQQRNRQLIATGFLMVAPKMLTERNKPKMHLDIADEQVDTIGRAVMGLTLGCARCHDHKFDPIPTADYYAMVGILHSTRTADGILMNNVNVSGWTETDLALDDESKALLARNRERMKQLTSRVSKLKAERDASQRLTGVVVDETDAKKTGPWRKSTYRKNRIGDFYLATDKGKSGYSITWKAELPKPGEYEVRVSFGGGSGLAKNAPYVVRHAKGESRLIVDQTVQPAIGGLWHSIGKFAFDSVAEIQLTDKDANGHVIADAVQFVHADETARRDSLDSDRQQHDQRVGERARGVEEGDPRGFKGHGRQRSRR